MKVPAVWEEHEFVPSVPAVTLPHEKLSAVVPVVSKVMELPLAAAVTVVVFVLELAVAPTAGKEVWQLLIAEARFAASLVVAVVPTKLPVVELEQPEVAAWPSVPVLGERVATALPVPPLLKVMLPVVAFVTVVTLVENVAVAPALAPDTLKQAEGALEHWLALLLMAAARFFAESLAVLP